MTPTQGSLQKLGFEDSAAEIYLLLINKGELNVSQILEQTKLSRTTVHQVLDDLFSRDFVEHRKDGRHVFYKPAHPSKLKDLLEENKKDLAMLEKETEETIRNLSGTYNLQNNKPGIRFYEGPEGFEEIFLQNLQAKETIYTYTNREAVFLQNKKTMEKYVEIIDNSGINEKVICVDTPDARELKARLKNNKTTQIKLLPQLPSPFESGMDMYDGKIIYATYKKNKSIQVIIEDTELCKMQRQIFETLWALLPE